MAAITKNTVEKTNTEELHHCTCAFCPTSEVVKKVDTLKKLADMQKDRGLLDKALEANHNALLLCKDRSNPKLKELQDQKQSIIFKKVHESIERIESGKSGCCIGLNATTVKKAIGHHHHLHGHTCTPAASVNQRRQPLRSGSAPNTSNPSPKSSVTDNSRPCCSCCSAATSPPPTACKVPSPPPTSTIPDPINNNNNNEVVTAGMEGTKIGVEHLCCEKHVNEACYEYCVAFARGMKRQNVNYRFLNEDEMTEPQTPAPEDEYRLLSREEFMKRRLSDWTCDSCHGSETSFTSDLYGEEDEYDDESTQSQESTYCPCCRSDNESGANSCVDFRAPSLFRSLENRLYHDMARDLRSVVKAYKCNKRVLDCHKYNEDLEACRLRNFAEFMKTNMKKAEKLKIRSGVRKLYDQVQACERQRESVLKAFQSTRKTMKRGRQSLQDTNKSLKVDLQSRERTQIKLGETSKEKTNVLRKIEDLIHSERETSAKIVEGLTKKTQEAELQALNHVYHSFYNKLLRVKSDCEKKMGDIARMLRSGRSVEETDISLMNCETVENCMLECDMALRQLQVDLSACKAALQNGKTLGQLGKFTTISVPNFPKLIPLPFSPSAYPEPDMTPTARQCPFGPIGSKPPRDGYKQLFAASSYYGYHAYEASPSSRQRSVPPYTSISPLPWAKDPHYFSKMVYPAVTRDIEHSIYREEPLIRYTTPGLLDEFTRDLPHLFK
ncbi:hypothetical protein QR680_018719 [Steinernema hermaphroditum]|uniref:Uncharacterized protein n=1 Tax=Steinernema hermaphroditum TaxID=289476 RepID=A0AA39HJR0_9BILA|nr:hypothetical protein QR680_018719 [Steinernema hermaphroditum]